MVDLQILWLIVSVILKRKSYSQIRPNNFKASKKNHSSHVGENKDFDEESTPRSISICTVNTRAQSLYLKAIT
jgi:hypothetical protein